MVGLFCWLTDSWLERIHSGREPRQTEAKFIHAIKKPKQMFQLFYVGLPGFEPRQTEPKSVVLPLYYRPIFLSDSSTGISALLGVQK